MSLKRRIVSSLNSILGPFDLAIARRSELQRVYGPSPFFSASTDLPREAESYLVQSNPRLQEIRKLYSTTRNGAPANSLWAEQKVKDVSDLRSFRGDNCYVYQLRGMRERVAAPSIAVRAS